MSSAILPSASAIMPAEPKRIISKKVIRRPKVVEEVEEVEEVKENKEDAIVMIKQSEYDSLLARIEALESKKKNVRESAPKKSAVRIPTKDIVLRDILRDGEEIFSKELINDGDDKGEYLTWKAQFVSAHNGFLIDEVDNESVWGAKRAYAMSPTTLCSRFRYLMKQTGQCTRGASTCCGFAKCYVVRDGVQMKLNTLW